MKKTLACIVIIILLTFVVSIIIGKKSIKHIDYIYFSSNVKYFSTPVYDVYKEFKYNKEMFIDDDKIKDVNDLINFSDYVLSIKVNKEPIFYGNGLINNVKILEVFKSIDDKNIKIGNQIRIYDLISYWSGDYANYYGGITPLNFDNEYIVFLKKANHGNLNNTYIFSSIRYGHFNISVSDDNVLLNYVQGSLTIGEIMKYDYVETDCESSGYKLCDKYADNYKMMKEQLINYLENDNSV